MRNIPSFGLLTIVLAACTPDPAIQLEDARYATGSRTMVADGDSQRLFALNIDEGTVSRVDLESRSVDNIDIGADPTRIARADNTYFVTLRGERSIGVFEDTGAGMQRLDTIEVGCEPFGIVATEDGSRLFVTLSQENRTIAIDVDTRQVTNSWPTPGDPRWMALHPKGDLLFVAPAKGRDVFQVNTQESGEEAVDVVVLPITERTTPDGTIELTPRIMGDMAVDPTGSRLVVPALYVDNKSQEDLPDNVDPTTLYYANPLPGVGRFNSALIEVPISSNGNVRDGQAQAIFLASFLGSEWGTTETIRSYPNSVTISPDGLFYAASLEGSDAVVTIGGLPYDRGASHDVFIDPGREVDPVRHGFAYRPHVTTLTNTTEEAANISAGPRAVVYVSDEEDEVSKAYVHTFLNLSITDLLVDDAHQVVENRGLKGLDSGINLRNHLETPVAIEESVLPVEIREGRKLFYAARNRNLVAPGAGVSCNTCHIDGRDDGLTWQLGPDVWQTPSLAGRVSDTHPVTWNKQIDTVADEAEATSSIRMGGGNLSTYEYSLIGAYVDYTAVPDNPARGVQNEQVARGQEIFEREDVGCSECHNGVAYTDNDHHDLYGLVGTNTPPLRGIAATGPYLHDGRAATIGDVLELSRAGLMGNTGMLDATEMAALEAYVMSL